MKICVLYGGWSAERPISLLSGRAVARALEEVGHAVVRVDPRDASLEEVPSDCDAVFILLHGGFGEGGGAQETLAARGIPYTGSAPEASRLAMDKGAAREAFRRAGLAIAPGLRLPAASTRTPPESAAQAGVAAEEEPPPDAAQIARAIGPPPWFVKPSREGSSLGVHRIVSLSDFPAALVAARAGGQGGGGRWGREDILVERAILGREFTVGILEGEPLPLIEIKPEREFYDYTAKYAPDGGTEYVVSPEVPPETEAAIRRTGLAAFSALGCSGAGRVDLILGRDGVPYVLEVNTIPGMTEKSLLPKAAAAAGIPFAALCERIVRSALAPR